MFLDASALVALFDHREQHFQKVQDSYRELLVSGIVPLTSNIMLAEFHALMIKRIGSFAACLALEELTSGRFMIELVRDDDHMRALQILHSQPAAGFSLADATSFALMERIGITIALTLDHHFRVAGFTTVPAPD